MMNLQLSIVCLALAMTSFASAHLGGGKSQFMDTNPQFYCGRNLARVLAMLCSDDVDKRSEGTMFNSILEPYHKDQEWQLGWNWMFQPKSKGLGLPSRGKRYIVSECCDKACSINELASYCYNGE